MIDPGALGTLVLGIEANRHDDERAAFAKARAEPPGRRRGSARPWLAMALRKVAAHLEPVAERPAATS